MSAALPRSLLLVTFLALLGCSSGSTDVAIPVTGRLLEQGQPAKIATQGLPPGEKGVYVGFVELDKTPAETYYAIVNVEDSTFKVDGHKGKGIPPGKYRITVSRAARGKTNPADAAFTEKASPLTTEVPASGTLKLKVDLGTKQVTAE